MSSGALLLTGASGFLGHYLLRELLPNGRATAVLIRDARGRTARQRADELLTFASDSLGRSLPRPVLLCGDLARDGLGLDPSARDWLARHRPAVVHAGACVTLRATFDGEPAATNVAGTRRLLAVCRECGLSEFHHVSTAFVCGEREGVVYENELEVGQRFHNEYEQSKCEAERLLRGTDWLRLTVYRPSVIVGDSVTGHTSSYHGFYRFLGLAVRLAETTASGRRHLPLRLPFTGDEPRDLVPVDWVARAIARIVDCPDSHGRTYHLTAAAPTPARLVKEVGEELLRVDGVTWSGPGRPPGATSLEETFLDHLQEYWPYLHGDPIFDRRNTESALPDLPCPPVDRALLSRLILFAAADGWGRAKRDRPRRGARFDCADYVERFFPESIARTSLSKVPLEITLGLDVRGAGGGRWCVRLRPGEPAEVRRGGVSGAVVRYRTDVATFESIVRGRQSPQEAFFARRMHVEGDVEKGLKVAVLFWEFVRECPYAPRRVEGGDVTPLCA